MTLEITLTLDDNDLERFRRLFRRARATATQTDRAQLLEAAAKRLDARVQDDVPAFVRERLQDLRTLVAMLQDTAWQLDADEQADVLDTIAYFVVGNDLIPDSTPVLGLLDDAIVAELAVRDLRHELDAYRDFSRFRTGEVERRAKAGEPTDVSKEDWLADRRAQLHSRMRSRRAAEPAGWRLRSFGV